MTRKNLGYCCLLALNSILFFSCTQDQPKKNLQVPAAKAPALMGPFRYHKMIEVSPGQDFDIMSWGRGSSTVGSLLILRSDSVSKNYTTTTGDLDGEITDVFNADMDIDGNPEILIEAKAKDTVDYRTVYAYEFKEAKANKLDFPKLTSVQKKGYRGNDNFYMKDGKLIREYPVYDGNTSTAKPTGQKRILQYNLRSNNLTVKDLSADTLKLKADTVVKKPSVVKSEKPAAKAEKTKSKHHKETPKKKKKKHHHRHDD